MQIHNPYRTSGTTPTDPASTSLRLHLGCGDDRWEGWINIDREPSSATDMVLDIRDLESRFPAGSCRSIHLMHAINYLTLWQARDFFASCRRLLEPGGELVLETPDASKLARRILENMEKDLDAYLDGIRGFAAFGWDHLQEKRDYSPNKMSWTPWHMGQELTKAGFGDLRVEAPRTHAAWRDFRMTAIAPSERAIQDCAASHANRGGRLLIVVDEEVGHVTAHIRGHMFVEPLSRKGWQATVLDARKDSRDRILSEAAASRAVLLAKVPSLELVRAIKAAACGPVVYDFTDALWLPFHQAHGWQDIDAILREADAIVCDNRHILQYALRHNPRSDLWPASTRVELFDQASARRAPRPDDKIRIGWVGSQGTASAIAAIAAPLARVASRHPGLELRALGCSDPSVLPRIPGLAVSCLGAYDEPTMIDEILAMDIGLFPAPASLEDFMNRGPLKGLLYMSGGVPCICQRGGELDDILRHGTDGYLADSPQAWEEALEKLLESRETRLAMGSSARSRVSDRALDPITDVLIERIETAIEARSGNLRAAGLPRSGTPDAQPSRHRPRILIVADVRGWIFERHARTLRQGLADRFEIDILYQGEPFREEDYDLIYPLEWNLVAPERISTPRKWITGIRSHVSWEGQDPSRFGEILRSRFQAVHAVSKRLCREISKFRPDVVPLTHGVDLEHFTASAPPFGQPGRIRIGWAGNRLSPVKGFEEFIAPLQDIPGVEIRLCGYSDTLLTKEQMKDFYEQIDVYICSSKSEGSNNSLLEAAAMGRAIITTDVGTVPEYLENGRCALVVERTPEAFRQAMAEIVADPARSRAMGQAARIAVDGFSWKRKLAEHASFFERNLRQAPSSAPGDIDAKIRLADSALEAGRSQEALSILREVESVVGEHSDLTLRIGRALVAAGQSAQAHQEFVKATRLWPDHAPSHANLAAVLVLRGQHERARASLEKVLELVPGDPDALFALGRCQLMSGDRPAATRHLTEIAVSNPEHPLADEARILMVGCGLSAPKRTRPPTRGIGCIPEHYAQSLDRGEQLLADNRPSEALPLFLAAEKAKEDDPVLLSDIGLCFKLLGDRESARSFIDRALYYLPSSPTLAEMRQALGELPPREVETVRDVPQPPVVRIHLAMLTFNALAFTKMTIESIVRNTRAPYRIHVRDNLSTDETRTWLSRQKASQLHVDLGEENLGVPGGRNALTDFAIGEVPDDGFLVFVDNDMEFFPGWETAALEYLDAHPEVGILSSDGHRLVIRGDERVLLPKVLGEAEVDVACGGYVCWIRAEVLRTVGGFDENLGLFWHEDDDFTIHAMANGWKAVSRTQTPVLHHGHQSGAALQGKKINENSPKNMAYLARKWRQMGMILPDGSIRRERLPQGARQVPRAPRTGRKPSTRPDGSREAPDRSEPPRSPERLAFAGPTLNHTGYGRLNRDLVEGLARTGLAVSGEFTAPDSRFARELSQTDPVAAQLWEEILARTETRCRACLVGDLPRFYDQHRAHHPGHDRYIGMSLFETDRLPSGWAEACNRMDEIWVFSEFNRRTYQAAGVEAGKLRVAPWGLRAQAYDPGIEPMRIEGRRGFTFLSVFEWTHRKGWDVLLEAWARAFSADDDVALVIKTWKGGESTRDLEGRIDRFLSSRGFSRASCAPILLVEEFLSDPRMKQLYAASDCFVLPSRGEGLGIPYLESMAMARPVIATDWSAHVDSTLPEFSYLIANRGLVPVSAEQTAESSYYEPSHLWADPDTDHLVGILRHAATHHDEVRARGALAREHILRHRTHEASIGWFADHLFSREPSTAPGPATMHVGFDLRTLSDPQSHGRGIGHYALHHMQAVARLAEDAKIRLTAILPGSEPDPAWADRFRGLPVEWMPKSGYRPGSFDVLHTPDPMGLQSDYESPLNFFDEPRTTALFHDLIPLRFYRESLGVGWPTYLSRLARWKDSDATFLCNSEFTSRELADALGVDASRRRTVMAGLNREGSANRSCDPAELKRRIGIAGDFCLFVGATDPHKNFDGVVKTILEANKIRPIQLVVTGRPNPLGLQWIEKIRELGLDRIIVHSGYLDRSELDALYQGAVCLLFLSRLEGFGFPALEAMAAGCPVVCSNAASLPEVVGESALVHDPEDLAGAVGSIQRLRQDPSLRNKLVQAGLERAKRFTWESTARRSIEVWRELMAKPARGPHRIARKEVGVNWISPVFDPSGYASESRAFLLALEAEPKAPSLRASGRHSERFAQEMVTEHRDVLCRQMDRPWDPSAPFVLNMPAGGFARLSDAPHVGRTTFETDSLPAAWVETCNRMDEIWVPSRFNLRTFRDAGVRAPILVIGEGVETDRFRPGLEPLHLDGIRRKTTFLAVFEWTHRKGPDILLAAWAKAFGSQDDVELVLRTYPANAIEGDPARWVEERIDETLRSIGRNRSDCAPIVVLGSQIPDRDMPRLYATAQVYLAPSRGEGWGRPHMEAMSSGLAVIATDWSGNLDFMDSTNSWLIPIEGLEPVDHREEFPLYRGHNWASPSIDAMSALLRRASTDLDARQALGRRARADMVEKWDWSKVAPLAAHRLDEIRQGIPADRSRIHEPAENLPAPIGSLAASQALALRWCGPMFNFSGYARLAREAVSGLMDEGSRVTADPIHPDQAWFLGLSGTERQRWTELLRREPSPGILVCCDIPRDASGANELFDQMREANPGCVARVGWTMFETDRLPAGWADSLNRLDEVWVPSSFNLRTFAESGVDPAKLHVVPGCIDPVPYANARPMAIAGPRRATTFLSVFQWTRRKGWDVLLRAWAQAFKPQADIRLVLRCHPFGRDSGSMRETYEASLRALGLTESDMAPVVLLEEFVHERDLPGLYAACDVFVLPSRGEGWGLPYLEAMAAGKPCIATAWGASMEFLSDDVAWLAYAREPVPVDASARSENPYLGEDHRWADPDPAEVADLLRRAASNVPERLEKARRAPEVAARWSRSSTARTILERIDALSGRNPSTTADLSAALGATASGILRRKPVGGAGHPDKRTEHPAKALAMAASDILARRTGAAGAGRDAGGEDPDGFAHISIRWEGSQFVHHSLANVNREMCLRLAKSGHDLSLIRYEPDQFAPGDDPDLSILASLHDAPLEGPCQVHVRHQWPPRLDAPSEGRWVVVQPWEFGSPPKDWIPAFRDRVDEIWCYSNYVKQVYLDAGIPDSKLAVVPLGVDTNKFRPHLDPLPDLPRDEARTTFLFVGGTIARKGFDCLLNAWSRAFAQTDPVRLVVKGMGGGTFYKGQTGEAMVRELNESGRVAPILLFERDLAVDEIPRVYACADILVHPYRGEGFGLPIAEAMSSGLACIVTRGGSADDFCGPDEAWLVDSVRTPVPGGKVGPFETVSAPWWLEPDLDSLVHALRAAFAKPDSRKTKGLAARKRIETSFTWDHAAAVVESRLRSLLRPSEHGRRVASTKFVSSLDKLSIRISAPTGANQPRTSTSPEPEDMAGLDRLLVRAEAAAARKDFPEALDLTLQAVEEHPGQNLAWIARAMILRGAGKFAKASDAITQAIRLRETPEALLESAQIHLCAGQPGPARKMEKALKDRHGAWLKATRELFRSRGQTWPLDHLKPAKAPSPSRKGRF